MSWIISTLLRSSLEIKSKPLSDSNYELTNLVNFIDPLNYGDYDEFLGGEENRNLLDDDDYNDLLIIEKKIKDLYSNGLLTDEELELIEHVSDGKPLNQVGTEINKSRLTMARKFYAITNRIAQSLGGYFTDEGYLDYMQNKYNLTEEQVDAARNYMESRFKYKIMRKII
jgi:hypothetical protein